MQLQAALRPSQKASIYPKAIVAQRLLSLPLLALRQQIEQELEENPGLEPAEEWMEAAADRSFLLTCPACPAQDREDQPETPATISLQQHLWESFLLESSNPRIRRIAYYLIHNLDDDGYLRCQLQEAAAALGTGQEEAREALRLVQGMDPPGVGARDLRECLLIQIGRLDTEVHPLTERIVGDYWVAFARRRFDLIARKMKIPLEQVEEVANSVRSRLSPYPGRGFRLPWQPPSRPPHLPAPDIVVHHNARWEVEATGSAAFPVRLSPCYLEIYRRMRANGVEYSAPERKHVAGCLQRARLFLEALEQRQRMLRQIAGLVVSLEERFLERGWEGLAPLSRADLARRLGVSLSTVSRALAGKYLLTPTGEMVSFDLFFDHSLPAKEIIRRLVDQEGKGKPLSDQEIGSRLSRQGVQIARRTVAKYREALGILPRSQRRCG